MRWNRTLIPTLKEDPQEAEINSHRLMLRAGMIRRVGGGLYTFLPLGLRVLRKVEAIVREEMDAAGASEILMPALQPRELWERSGRYDGMGDVMFRVRDRQDRDMVLGPTHEEVITDLAARELNSYRQLPKTFYQIQTKFRDEIRPRFGLMRAKEFIMKDAYSFDVGWDEADASYEAMYDAYVRIFERCGLRTKVVEADTGAMGGKWSHEFMVLAEAGEDGIVECEACDYAANLERAERRVAADEAPCPAGAPEPVDTPNMRTIDEVAGFLQCEAGRLVKTMIYLLDGQPAAVLVSGDRDVNEHKLARELGAATIEPADEPTIERLTGARVGFAGPVGLPDGTPVYADGALRNRHDVVTGANADDRHLRYVDLSRDARITAYHDLVVVQEGDACPRCGERLREQRGIEVGHVFKLGTKYSESFEAMYLDEKGARHPMVMGCYGIGVTRTVQAIVEQRADDNGIRWPAAVAPFEVVILNLDPSDPSCRATVEQIEGELADARIDVLVDDREERPGVKFKDADLIGIPWRVVVGKRGLKNDTVEIKSRDAAQAEDIPCRDAGAAIVKHLQS